MKLTEKQIQEITKRVVAELRATWEPEFNQWFGERAAQLKTFGDTLDRISKKVEAQQILVDLITKTLKIGMNKKRKK